MAQDEVAGPDSPEFGRMWLVVTIHTLVFTCLGVGGGLSPSVQWSHVYALRVTRYSPVV